MRQFKLINADGEEVNLMDRASFFHRPSGLGYSYSYAIQGAGSEFIPTEKSSTKRT